MPPNDFRPKRSAQGSKPPKVFALLKPELDLHIEEIETEENDEVQVTCRCDKVCTCDTVKVKSPRCRCDTVAKCTCQAVQLCSCDTVMVCSCDAVKVCRCNPQCGCDSHTPSRGGGRVCRCVPVRAH